MAPLKISAENFVERVRRFCDYDRYAWRFPCLILAILLLLVIVEFVFSPFEKALGEYMAWTRPVRQEIGTGWDFSREGEEAERKLGRLAKEIHERQTAGLTISDWSELPEILNRHRIFSISPQRFLDLYKELPLFLQSVILDPVELLRIRTDGRWQRVFFMDDAGTARIYLVDSNNFVLVQVALTSKFFERLEALSHPVPGSLEELEHFHGLAFPASLFFNVVEPVGAVRLSGLDANWVAGLSGKLTRVAVALKTDEGLRALGFEVERNDSLFVFEVWIDADEAQNLFTEMMDRSLYGGGL